LRGVLELAAEKAGWGRPLLAGRGPSTSLPSTSLPSASLRAGGTGRAGRGIAGHYSFQSYVAQVAEVSVDANGRVRVHRVVCAVDCGRAVNPDGVKAQMESGIVYGLTAALKGAITIQNGAVEQSNFHNYQMLRIGEMPRVEVHIMPSAEPPSGTGEPGVPPIAGAVGNALFAATGKRLRRLPIRAEDLKPA
ncbi:MAG: molybdopterin cofactor-binding domain-containing protein, partial [Terriglobia bacterium]